MFTSLRSRLFATYLVVISVTLCVVAGALLFILLNSPLPSRQTYQRLEAVALAQLPDLPVSRIETYAAWGQIAQKNNVRILRLSPRHLVLYDSNGELDQLDQFTTFNTRDVQQETADTRGIFRDSTDRVWLTTTFPAV